ncbi:hypothetical protein NNJEOMEG_03372 [Fundidesulfovibrio magnetotacticus]|uniref:Zinc finger/thioredoxin putative domain-containing protein n=1 Tax=Fundidesulfovibrio magnetotacticus TaxID=2730080 RepID=A0A6V8M0X8_9BACT|nr:DUF3426 domain-containing protein [Fundidesulfovibrio magnetotacticus]GFK95507.1 hypothetical protein NNJEOMEG_03372 [Fundidesulfovibrio magnetotacticus]
MIVECPNCQTKYNLPDDKVGPEGATVRCSVCRHVFKVEPAAPDDFPGFGDSGDSTDAGIWPVSGEDETPGDDFAAHLDAQRKKDPFEAGGVSSSDFGSIDFGKPEKTTTTSKGKKIAILAALGVVLLAGVGGAAAYFFEFWPFAKKTAVTAEAPAKPSVMENAPAAPPAPPAPPPADYTGQILFDGFSNYFVDNEKAGRLFVIDGKLVNRSPVTVGQIEVEATLLDAKDAPVVTKVFKAGPKANISELRLLGKEDLENRLSSKEEIMLYNRMVKPGEEVPFMVAFANMPENVRNFSLKLKDYLQVADPAQQQPAGQKQ